MDRSDSRELESRYKTTAIIMIAVFLVVVVLATLSWFYLPYLNSGTQGQDLTPLWVLILFVAAGSFVLRRSLIRFERLRDKKLLGGTISLFKTLQFDALLMALISLAIALAGTIASIFSGDGFDGLRAAAVAIIVLAINFPRLSVWKRIVELLEDV